MHHDLDNYYLALHHLERQEKMRVAEDYWKLRNAGINPYRIVWSQIREAIRSFILRLSLFEKPENPCLDCPPAGA